MTKLPVLGAHVLYLMISSSQALLSLHSLETVPENDGMGDLYVHGELSGLNALLCARGMLSTTGASMFVNGYSTHICTRNESSH